MKISTLALTLLLLIPGVAMAQQVEPSYTTTPSLNAPTDIATAKVDVPEYTKPFQGTWMVQACPTTIGATIVINGEFTQLLNLATSANAVQTNIGAIASFNKISDTVVSFTYANTASQYLNFKLTYKDGKLTGVMTIEGMHGEAQATTPITLFKDTYKGDLSKFLQTQACPAK